MREYRERMDESVLAIVSFTGISMVAACVLVLMGKTGFSSQTISRPGSARSLPLPSGPKNKDPWFTDWSRFDDTTFTGGSMNVSYPGGKFGGSTGAAFRARPFKMFPKDSATVGCSIFIPSDFNFTKGGKLGPGLCIGTDIGVCATGGDHMETAGSARVTFSEAGEAVAYLYIPEQVDASHGRTGDKVVRSGKLRKGAWNDVSLSVTLGAPGKSGNVVLSVNGSKVSTSVTWRKSSSIKISGVLFATFFGGSTSNYAPSKPQKLSYKNFWVA